VSLLPRNPNAFTRSPLDRAGHRRRDDAWLAQAFAAPSTLILPYCEHRPFVIEVGERIAPGWLDASTYNRAGPGDATRLFLGVDAQGAAHFAVDVLDASAFSELGRFDDLRALGARLSHDDLAMLGPAKSVFEWHARNGYCARCGTPSVITEAGWKRQCPACDAEHFPRVDPVCIMLPVFEDKCFLARQALWPRGMHSALAGFIEPGEAIEEAVARETMEEAGLKVLEVHVHSTQPWPFPHSLMIGVIARVAGDAETIDPHELESGRWFSREDAALLLAGRFSGAFCPPPFAIAHQLLQTWVRA
jgi:NAD+ diphosphatase